MKKIIKKIISFYRADDVEDSFFGFVTIIASFGRWFLSILFVTILVAGAVDIAKTQDKPKERPKSVKVDSVLVDTLDIKMQQRLYRQKMKSQMDRLDSLVQKKKKDESK